MNNMPKLNTPTNFSELEIKILKQVQGDLPQTLNPYAVIAETVGCSEHEVLQFLQKLAKMGIIRRFGAILKHQQAGFSHNGLLAWDVRGLSPNQVDALGQTLAACPKISHCYLRKPVLLGPSPNLNSNQNSGNEPDCQWLHQLFSMLHACSKQDFDQTKSDLYQQLKAVVTNLPPPLCLESLQELKKTSMKYF